MSKRKVEQAHMHQAIFLPDAGTIGPELYSKSDSKNKAVKMDLEKDFVRLEVLDKFKKTRIVLIPLSNFKDIVVSESE